jgi:hypothetical protein
MTCSKAHPATAPGTRSRANRQALAPSDRLLFRAGDAFDGNLVVKVNGSPSAKYPITIGSYGNGKATIRAGNGTGVAVQDTGGLVVRDLMVEGKERRTNQGSGVLILNTLPGGTRLDFIRVENVEARGFGKDGIAVAGAATDNSRSGFQDVKITGCRASDNAYVGIHVYGKHDYYAKTYSNRNLAIVDCMAYENPGDPDYVDNHSGNGIMLHDVDGGLIDGSTAYGNGNLCRAKGGGPVGIWAWSTRKLIIQNCVSTRNRTGGSYDGGCFDFDGGVSESIMQYNYSAENDGAGFMVFDFGAAPFRLADNIIRFNISENDGRKNNYAGIVIKSLGEPIERVHVYHNTVFVSSSPSGRASPAAVFVDKVKDCRFHNNLLITAGGCRLFEVGHDQSGLFIQGNHYWATDNRFLIRQGAKEVSSLSDWRRLSEMERLNGKDVGGEGDPQLNGLGGEVITHASKRTSLNRYQPQNQSSVWKSGLNLQSLFHVDSVERDFWGNSLSKDGTPTVGAGAKQRLMP